MDRNAKLSQLLLLPIVTSILLKLAALKSMNFDCFIILAIEILYDNDNSPKEKHISLAVYVKLSLLRPRACITELQCTRTCIEFDSAASLAIL